MKSLLRRITALLSLTALILLMASCGAPDSTPSEDTEKQSEEQIDLDGYTFEFKAFTEAEGFFKPESSASVIGDKILKRYEDTGKKFNAVINVSTISDYLTCTNDIVAANMVQKKYADLVDTIAWTVFLNQDNFEPLNDIDGFDITLEKWGPANYLETACFDGKNYGFMAYNWGLPYPSYIGNLFFMKSVICDEFGLVNPQELYESGNWYWEQFRDYSRKLTVNDNNDPANNRYGFVISGEMKMPRAFVISNGVQLISKNETTGLYENNINDPHVAEALSYLKDMVDEGIGYYTADLWEEASNMFKEKRTAFYEAYNKSVFLNSKGHLASDLGEDYSWLPYPCGPNGTYGTSTAQFWHTSRFLTLPLFSDPGDLENAIVIINDIFEPLDGETATSWRENVYNTFFFDELSFKYYIDLFENGHTDYSASVIDVVTGSHFEIYSDILEGVKSVPEAIKAQADSIQTQIDSVLNHLG